MICPAEPYYYNGNSILKDFRGVVSVDALKYRQMGIDNITSDISKLTANSNYTKKSYLLLSHSSAATSESPCYKLIKEYY